MKKLSVCLLFISVSFGSGLFWSRPAQGKQKRSIGIVTGRIVNVRSVPSLKGKVITQCAKGEPVQYIGRNRNLYQIGKQRHYWHRVKTQDGRLGWVYGKYLAVLSEHAKGKDGILRNLIRQEFSERLFHPDYIFKFFALKIVPFQKKNYYLFSYEWHDNDVTSIQCSIYLPVGEEYRKIADTVLGNRYYFYDLDSDGNAEIISLDKGRGSSVFVYSEKERKEIFRYSFYSSGLFDLLENINDSYIEVKELQPKKQCEIRIHIRQNQNEPMVHVVYRWDGRTFRVDQ